MENKVLIVFASKYGATREIAEEIGECLEEVDLEVEIISVEQVTGVDRYRAVVIGSAVYLGRWRRRVKHFLTENEEILSRKPVWIFSSGPTGTGQPEVLLKGWKVPVNMKKVVKNINPVDVMVFHGKIDLIELNMFERLAINKMRIPSGDYRNVESIREWANSIISYLNDNYTGISGDPDTDNKNK
ncbi:MAG: flavodoxin domain-containing protein [Bacteroidales bacterium]|nr:flavodoxin domain-containing protein [Bacteroidales bacterium]